MKVGDLVLTKAGKWHRPWDTPQISVVVSYSAEMDMVDLRLISDGRLLCGSLEDVEEQADESR